MPYSAHVDTFARDNLPPRDQWPEFPLLLPELHYPERMNAATMLLDRAVERGWGGRLAIAAPDGTALDLRRSSRAAPIGSRACSPRISGSSPAIACCCARRTVPMHAACWFAVLKAGGIAVGTMPLLRARELTAIVTKARISHALCDHRLAAELEAARPDCPMLQTVVTFGTEAADGLDALAAGKSSTFANVDTAADDTALIAFTSGTTGKPKGTMHFHRDVMAACDCWPRSTLRASPDDLFTGSPPLAFTFGLGGLLLFPLSIGAATLLIERPAPESLLPAVARHRVSVLVTAPTAYRSMAAQTEPHDLSSLRKCVSAGEALPASTRQLWKQATGIEIIDGIGATEMFHIFISHDEAHAKPGATGRPIPGYVACVMDASGNPLPPGEVGLLAVKGPTGCRYLADERQSTYVKGGWNYTGDAYLVDADGDFVYQARTDDMIVSAGYNIAGPEVEGGAAAASCRCRMRRRRCAG